MKDNKLDIEKDFFSAFNANDRKNIEVAVAQVAHYRGLKIEDVNIRLKHILENLRAGNSLL